MQGLQQLVQVIFKSQSLSLNSKRESLAIYEVLTIVFEFEHELDEKFEQPLEQMAVISFSARASKEI